MRTAPAGGRPSHPERYATLCDSSVRSQLCFAVSFTHYDPGMILHLALDSVEGHDGRETQERELSALTPMLQEHAGVHVTYRLTAADEVKQEHQLAKSALETISGLTMTLSSSAVLIAIVNAIKE